MTARTSDLTAPRAFLTYSWDGVEHKQWVAGFADRLQGASGVEIIFDQWHLTPGSDRLHFMEQGVANSDFVIVVCTPIYAERANKRSGGVGYESMVITAELGESILTTKFIPVLRQGQWESSLPNYLKSKVGVDLTGEPYSEDEYEKLLRVLHRELIQPPPIAKRPDFSGSPKALHYPAAAPETIPQVSPQDSASLKCKFSPRALIFVKELSIEAFPIIEECRWAEEIELSINVNSPEIDSIFSRLRGYRKALTVAYGFDVAITRLKALDRIVVGGKASWKILLEPTRVEFSSDFEMGTMSLSADDSAEKRARRLLLNENPVEASMHGDDESKILDRMMNESLLQGSNSLLKIERSIFPELYDALSKERNLFLEIAWITAITFLKMSAAVQHVYNLTLELDNKSLRVDFLGTRFKRYSNAPAYEIAINGVLSLATLR